MGLSKQKSSYLKDMAGRASRGELDFTRLPEMTDDEVIKHLTQVKGVGVWTAHMFLMFTLRRPNVLPTGDYGIQMAIKKHYKKRKMPKPEVMAKIAKAWEPYRSRGLLVSVAKSGYQDHVEGRFQIADFRLRSSDEVQIAI